MTKRPRDEEEIINDKELVDTIVVCSDGELEMVRYHLCKYSRVFTQMFQSEMKESKMENGRWKINIPEISRNTVIEVFNLNSSPVQLQKLNDDLQLLSECIKFCHCYQLKYVLSIIREMMSRQEWKLTDEHFLLDQLYSLDLKQIFINNMDKNLNEDKTICIFNTGNLNLTYSICLNLMKFIFNDVTVTSKYRNKFRGFVLFCINNKLPFEILFIRFPRILNMENIIPLLVHSISSRNGVFSHFIFPYIYFLTLSKSNSDFKHILVHHEKQYNQYLQNFMEKNKQLLEEIDKY